MIERSKLVVCFVNFVLLCALVVNSSRASDDVESGPQVGATVPGQFFSIPVNGRDAGDDTCLYCKFGNAPVVMIFASKPTAEVARLVKALEPVAAKADPECGICVIVTDASAESRRELGKLADEAKLKRTILATVDPANVKDWRLDPAAGATVLLYRNKVVRANFASKPGSLDIPKLMAEVRTHLGVAADPPPRDFAWERYELGRRLKAFEARWEKVEDERARLRACEKMTAAHGLFLTLRFGEAARVLDQATFALDSDDLPGTGHQRVSSISAAPKERFVDGNAKELAVELRTLYPVKGDPPKNLEVQLWFNDKQITTVKPDRFPFEVKVPLPPLGDSAGLDRTLYCLIESGRVQRHYTIGVSQVKERDARLAALESATEKWVRLDTIEQATARDRAALLASLVSGTAEETDIPAADLLANAEAMLNGKPFFSMAKPGEYWMSVPLGGTKTAPVRVYIPRGLTEGKPVPVVVGLHGAGGSENVFFEGYGAGHAIAECRRRGWVFVATRSALDFRGAPPVPVILDELGKRFPVDSKRTFLIGHSMGAGQVANLAAKHPVRFAAVACLAGGGAVRDAKPFAELPTFVAGGEKDFGLAPAKALHKSLVDGGAKRTSFKEYAGIEHLIIVRAALPAVFEFFDSVVKR
jgi:pimeloyl-ACP methyl ester carboxylesterase